MTDSTHAGAAIMAARLAAARPAQLLARASSTTGTAGKQPALARHVTPLRFLAMLAGAFVIMFGLAWAYVAEMPMAFLDMNYPLWLAKRSMLDACKTDGVAVFGDSRALASAMPSVMSIPVTNFAMAGTTPIETYFSVARALRCPTPPKLVVISHVPLKFMADIDYWHIGAKFGLLGYADMRAVDADAARLHDGEIEDLQRGDRLWPALRERLFAARFPPFYFDSIVHGLVVGRWMLNRATLRDSLLASGHSLVGRAAGSSGVAPEGRTPTYTPSPMIDLYFSRTLALLARHGIPVIFLSMPMNHATYVQTRPEFRAQFAAYLQAKAKQYPALRIVGPIMPCWPDAFFGDYAHFNGRGAEAYSRELGPLLSRALSGATPASLPGRCPFDG